MRIFLLIFLVVFASLAYAQMENTSLDPAQVAQSLQQNLNAANQGQIQASEKISQLEKQNNALQQKITALSQQVNELAQAKNTHIQPLLPSRHQQAAIRQQQIGQFDIGVSIGLFVIAILMFIWLLWPYFTGKKTESKKTDAFAAKSTALPETAGATETTADNEEDEYDFLGSKEGIPARLDLARAYIEMGDTNVAETILQDIIAVDEAEYKHQAEQLLGKIQSI